LFPVLDPTDVTFFTLCKWLCNEFNTPVRAPKTLPVTFCGQRDCNCDRTKRKNVENVILKIDIDDQADICILKIKISKFATHIFKLILTIEIKNKKYINM
jgi:hypothetical protein